MGSHPKSLGGSPHLLSHPSPRFPAPTGKLLGALKSPRPDLLLSNAALGGSPGASMVEASPVQPFLCSCSRRPQTWQGARVAARVRSSERPKARVSAEALSTPAARVPAAKPPSQAGLGATARARLLAGARGVPGPPAAASRDSSWQIGGIRQE